ncbi:helix-turn-helix domain-containing protein [Candidatus Woesearchaeota archaeon]|nr:helix-turn-helix domain-containing protein [Candidatus Woesearchaeota archaeon]
MQEEFRIEDGFEIRIEARLKNAALVKAREELGLTQEKAAEQIGINKNVYNSYECMRNYPTEKHRFIICDFYTANGVPLSEEETFPRELREIRVKKRVVDRVLSRAELISLTGVDKKLLPSVRLDEGKFSETNELKSKLESVLSDLPYDLQIVVRLRYGIDDGTGEIHGIRSKYVESQHDEMTYEQIGEYLGISREEARRREIMLFRKIRNPLRSKSLRDFLD